MRYQNTKQKEYKTYHQKPNVYLQKLYIEDSLSQKSGRGAQKYTFISTVKTINSFPDQHYSKKQINITSTVSGKSKDKLH